VSRYEVVVIGAGLAGLTAACGLAGAGRKTLLIADGIGALLLSSGCIDLLGYQPADSLEPLTNPLAHFEEFITSYPDHPYALLGQEALTQGLALFKRLVAGTLEYRGELERNWLLPSALGAVRPTCLAPRSFVAGDLSRGGPMLIIGFRELRDFYPGLLCANLNAQNLGVQAEALLLDAPPPLAGRMNLTPLDFAQAFELPDFRRVVAWAIKGRGAGSRIGLPAVLGLSRHAEVLADLEEMLEHPVFEISTLPPSVPGRRLFDALRRRFEQAGGRLLLGSRVVAGTMEAGRVTSIQHETANRLRSIRADHFVLATGGIYGGGLQTDAEGHVWEPIFNLPIQAAADRDGWVRPNFLDPRGQPVANYGVRVNERLNPVAENLYVAGAALAGADWTRGRTGEGVALATAATIVPRLSPHPNPLPGGEGTRSGLPSPSGRGVGGEGLFPEEPF
jgi:glycerol-3-phosphate dehydrogenase subunit B